MGWAYSNLYACSQNKTWYTFTMPAAFLKHSAQQMLAALRTRTGRDTQLVFSGQTVNAGLGFLANILLMRTLSLADYGLFSLFISALMLISGFMHFGWNETFVRFGAKYQHSPFFNALRKLLLKKTLLASTLGDCQFDFSRNRSRAAFTIAPSCSGTTVSGSPG